MLDERLVSVCISSGKEFHHRVLNLMRYTSAQGLSPKEKETWLESPRGQLCNMK